MRLPSILSLASLLSLSLSLAACGDDPSIVGAWRELPNAFDDEPPTIAEREGWQFKDDGTVMLTGDGDDTAGTYTLDGDRLSITVPEDDGDTSSVSATVVITENRLLFGALTPSGDVDGAVGSWVGDVAFDGRVATMEMELRADGTGDFTRREGTEDPEEYSGTWTEQGESLRFSFQPEPDFTVNFRLFRVGEEGLGGPLFEKL